MALSATPKEATEMQLLIMRSDDAVQGMARVGYRISGVTGPCLLQLRVAGEQVYSQEINVTGERENWLAVVSNYFPNGRNKCELVVSNGSRKVKKNFIINIQNNGRLARPIKTKIAASGPRKLYTRSMPPCSILRIKAYKRGSISL